jgi:hypothetical protein
MIVRVQPSILGPIAPDAHFQATAMLSRGQLTALLVVTAFARCSSPTFPVEPPSLYPYALAQRDCAPVDGPATSIYLTQSRVEGRDPSPPFVRVSVYESPATAAGRNWTWTGSDVAAGALRCDTLDACVTSSGGTMALSHFATDSAITAAVDVRFPDGMRVRGTVRAEWRRGLQVCG